MRGAVGGGGLGGAVGDSLRRGSEVGQSSGGHDGCWRARGRAEPGRSVGVWRRVGCPSVHLVGIDGSGHRARRQRVGALGRRRRGRGLRGCLVHCGRRGGAWVGL